MLAALHNTSAALHTCGQRMHGKHGRAAAAACDGRQCAAGEVERRLDHVRAQERLRAPAAAWPLYSGDPLVPQAPNHARVRARRITATMLAAMQCRLMVSVVLGRQASARAPRRCAAASAPGAARSPGRS